MLPGPARPARRSPPLPHRYQTEIVVPADRFVMVQLPDDIPEGPAVVTFVSVGDGGPVPEATEADRDDIEWFEDANEIVSGNQQ